MYRERQEIGAGNAWRRSGSASGINASPPTRPGPDGFADRRIWQYWRTVRALYRNRGMTSVQGNVQAVQLLMLPERCKSNWQTGGK